MQSLLCVIERGKQALQNISEVTRRDIIDILINGFVYEEIVDRPHPDYFYYQEAVEVEVKINIYGRLSEIVFLNRLYDLKQLPSTDSRFCNAEGDIQKHTVMNDDWDDGWVFNDIRFQLCHGNDDEFLLNFLCEVFHPAVRVEKEPWQGYLNKINELLQYDGYEIYVKDHISGRSVYGWKEVASGQKIITAEKDKIKHLFNTDYVHTQVDLMYEQINTAPNSAIGKSKELLEMCCKTILDEQNIEYDAKSDLMQLMNKACESIELSPKRLKTGVAGKDIAARILGNLTNIAHGMAELRNLYGDGHGKNKNFQPLPPRYAHLTVGASVTVVHFMWATYQERIISRGLKDK